MTKQKRHGNDTQKIKDSGYLLERRGHFKGSYNNFLSWVLVHGCLLLFLLAFFQMEFHETSKPSAKLSKQLFFTILPQG